MKISSIQKESFTKKLFLLQEKLVEVEEQLRDAAALGDHSENSEYEAATLAFSSTKAEIVRLKNTLENSELAEEDNSPNINIGCLIEVEDQSTGESRLLLLDAEGDSAISGILSINSPLGSAVVGKPSGIYKIKSSFGNLVTYKVNKLQMNDVNTKRFTDTYRDISEVLDEYFKVS